MSSALRTDLRVLVLRSPQDDPVTLAWTGLLTELGVPYDEVLSGEDDPLVAADLLHPGDASRGRYQAVVLTADSSAFWGRLGELRAYRARFGVRQVFGFEFPRDEVGLAVSTGRDVGGVVACLTPEGRATFPGLAGPLPLAPGAYGYPATCVSDRVTPLVVDPDGHSVVACLADDGLEDLVLTVNYSRGMVHWQLLGPGLLAWVTRGTHWGFVRHYLACHVDDVFLPNWTVPTPGAAPGDVPTVRMDEDDVQAVLTWQDVEGFVLDLVYNGIGGDPDRDPLTVALLRDQSQFRWINHTYDHVDLGSTLDDDGGRRWLAVEEIRERITGNVAWARSVGVDIEPAALVTGAHSGLDNPHLAEALRWAGVTTVAADASRQPQQYAIGGALTAPRHPTNVYTHVTTREEQVSEYNRLSGRVPAASFAEFLEAEGWAVLGQVLADDPRPVFAHQSNLTRDRVLLALLGHVLRLHRSYVDSSAPLCSPRLTDTALELQRRAAWRRAVEEQEVVGSVGGGRVCIVTRTDLDVPLTAPAGTRVRHRVLSSPFGEPYAGARSAWQHVRAGTELRLDLPKPTAAGGRR